MSDLPSVSAKIQVEATRFRSAVSEFLAQGVGSSINFLIDDKVTQDARLAALEGKVPNVVFGPDPGGGGVTVITVPITLQVASNSVRISIQPTGAGVGQFITNSGSYGWKRGAVALGTMGAVAGSPASHASFVDAPGSVGPHTYSLTRVTGVGFGFTFYRLVAEEIIL